MRWPLPVVRSIPLTQGQQAWVDQDDYELVATHKWFAQRARHTFYAVRREQGSRKNIHMQRQIMQPESIILVVDHKNRNGINNCRYNLRVCTKVQNSQNSRHRKRKYKYRGVHTSDGVSKWYARIKVNYRDAYLGTFPTQEDAARAYDRAAIQHYGEFATLNFPRENYDTSGQKVC